jgi:hypothetical protein
MSAKGRASFKILSYKTDLNSQNNDISSSKVSTSSSLKQFSNFQNRAISKPCEQTWVKDTTFQLDYMHLNQGKNLWVYYGLLNWE